MSEPKSLKEIYLESKGRHTQIYDHKGEVYLYLVGDYYLFELVDNSIYDITTLPTWRGVISYSPQKKAFTIYNEKDSGFLDSVFRNYSFHDHLEVLLVMKT